MKPSLGRKLLLGEYALLWRAARPVLRRHKRLRDDFSLRLVPDDWGPESPVDLWIQAASGGESFLARQLLEALRFLVPTAQQPLRILCTSCTRQGLDVLHAAASHAAKAWPALDVTVRVFPLDEPERMRRAVALASPRAVTLLETELWPGLMAACAEKEIPMLVVNGRMTEKSYSGYRWFAPLWRQVAPERILVMADPDAARFAALFGYDRVSVMPNMKFDAVPETLPALFPDSPAATLLPEGLPVILLASVREEEESLLAPVVAELRSRAPEAAIVVAPRHMERVQAWKALPQAPVALRSDLARENGAALAGQVVVWDAFGELTALYARADAVFVGGSLAPLGGQNFLEPAGQGKIPVIGPHWKNFAWVGEEFFTAGLAVRVANAAELGSALIDKLRPAPAPALVRERLAAYVDPRRGGTRLAAEAVWAVLGKNR
ncbi:3-deoxy-D-manno-octulosonic acid transferase [Desulfovibrio sp. OttesenSCG-928-O18]|nr:3-deoxy-D-manno-octulosonic acid transferase [Desulfovibrio sp. OttesenSCG-928-O18]